MLATHNLTNPTIQLFCLATPAPVLVFRASPFSPASCPVVGHRAQSPCFAVNGFPFLTNRLPGDKGQWVPATCVGDLGLVLASHPRSSAWPWPCKRLASEAVDGKSLSVCLSLSLCVFQENTKYNKISKHHHHLVSKIYVLYLS